MAEFTDNNTPASSHTPNLRFAEFKNPIEWEERILKDVSLKIFDGTHQTPKYTNSGIPFFSVENIISNKQNKFISEQDYMIAIKTNKPEKGDILITRIGNIGFSKVITWDYPFSIYVTLAVIKQSHLFNSYYLHCFMQSHYYQKEILSKSLLSAVPCKINMDSLRNTKVLLPTLPEQQKIADCLSSLDDVIEASETKLILLQNHKKGMMQKLFPKIDDNETTPTAHIPTRRFPNFTDEWEEKALKELAKIVTGDKNTQDNIDDGQYPLFIRSKTIKRINSYSLDCEAILTIGDGDVGKIFHYINGKFSFHQRVYCICDFKDDVYGQYIFYYFSTHFYRRVKKMSAKSTVDSVRMDMISEMKILLPPLPEQQKIADCLASLDEMIDAQTHQIATLKAHKKGLMQQLFPNQKE